MCVVSRSCAPVVLGSRHAGECLRGCTEAALTSSCLRFASVGTPAPPTVDRVDTVDTRCENSPPVLIQLNVFFNFSWSFALSAKPVLRSHVHGVHRVHLAIPDSRGRCAHLLAACPSSRSRCPSGPLLLEGTFSIRFDSVANRSASSKKLSITTVELSAHI